MAGCTLPLFRPSVAPPSDGPIYVANGLGTNSVAVLVLLVRLGLAPRVKAIVTTDPGSERLATYRYFAEHLHAYCAANGLPEPVLTSRGVEAQHRGPRAWRAKEGESLYQECVRTARLPSAAYGYKKCSQKFKAEVSRWWIQRQPWALDCWKFKRVRELVQPETGGAARWRIRQVPADGHQKVVKVIGYDIDEPARVMNAFPNPWEQARFTPWYPLFDSKLDRDDCADMIRKAGLPDPGKSACTFCPNNTRQEWIDLAREEPEAFARAVALSRAAAPTVENPDVVGLLRCNPHGKRQLHVWVDGGYGDDLGPEVENAQPCECAL